MQKFRSIVIEDDESCRDFISLLLARRGYEVLSFEDPTACPVYSDPECGCPHEHACGDFLVTDIRMPKMTGLDFIEFQTLKGCKGMVKNKAVFSGSWTPEEKERAKKLGCKAFDKPFHIQEVIAWLEEREKSIPPERKLASFEGV